MHNYPWLQVQVHHVGEGEGERSLGYISINQVFFIIVIIVKKFTQIVVNLKGGRCLTNQKGKNCSLNRGGVGVEGC